MKPHWWQKMRPAIGLFDPIVAAVLPDYRALLWCVVIVSHSVEVFRRAVGTDHANRLDGEAVSGSNG